MSKTQMEECCDKIIKVFHDYSLKTPHHDRLSKAEFAKMLKEQFPNFLQANKNPDAADRLFKELDQNKDKELSFEEFMGLVGKFLIECHDKFHHVH